MDASLMDVAPTVVHLTGALVPEESDGTVLLELFEPGAEPRRRDVRYAPAGIGAEEGEAYSAEEQALIEKQLRDLGYLG